MPTAAAQPARTVTASGSAPRSWVERLGIPQPLAWGFLGCLLFMIGDGVESGFLSPYLVNDKGISEQKVALLFSVYGIVAALAAWASGALSDLWGPRQVMWVGLIAWIAFQVLFLGIALPDNSFSLMLVAYGLRGIGYPLFAFGFLVWIAASTPQNRLGTAVGWFWFAFTGGLPTLGALLASALVPQIGQYETFWVALGLVVVGGLIALLGIRERVGRKRLAPEGQRPLATLAQSVTLMFENPKIGVGCIVRTINTAAELGFLVFLPLFFTKTIGFSLGDWLRLLSYMFATNIIFNLIFGVVGDKVGWRQTVAFFGGVGCAITTLLLYYVPKDVSQAYPLSILVGCLYGATLAGYVPLSALMPSLAPESKGAAMSALNLGAGLSAFVGPAIVGIFLGPFGVEGVMWVFAGLYIASAVMALFLRLPHEVEEQLEAASRTSAHPIGQLAARAGSSLLGHPVAMRTPAGEDEIDAILFDIGGTIYDDDTFAQAVRKAVHELAGEIEDDEFWSYYDELRESGGQALRSAFARRFVQGDLPALRKAIDRNWEYPPSALYPDVIPALAALAGRYKLGLIANSPPQVRDALRRDGIEELFGVIALGMVDGLPEKPDPAIFLYALDQLRVSAGRAVYVGNRLDADVRGSSKVGLRSIWMLRGEAPPAPTPDQLSEPDAVITSLIGLPVALARMTSTSAASRSAAGGRFARQHPQVAH